MKKFYSLILSAAAALGASAAIPGAPTEFNLVDKLPEGATSAVYARHGMSYSVMNVFDQLFFGSDDLEKTNSTTTMALYGGKCYIGPSALSFTFYSSYLVGDVADGIVTFTFPQALGETDQFGTMIQDYVALFSFDPVNTENSFELSETQELKYALNDDLSLTALDGNKNLAIGQVYWGEVSEKWLTMDEPVWDYVTEYVPTTSLINKVPETAQFERVNFLTGQDGRYVQMAIDGSDIYLRGVASRYPDMTLKGTIGADGTTSFPKGQCIGIDDGGCPIYALPAERPFETMYIDEMIGTVIVPKYVGTDILMTYDAEKQRLSPITAIMFSGNKETFDPKEYYDEFTIAKPSGLPLTPNDPVITEFKLTDGQYYSELYFSISNRCNEVDLLDPEQLYFSIYLDDEIFEFYSDEYPSIADGTTEIIYGYDDQSWGDDMSFAWFKAEKQQGMIVCPQGMQTIGVQAVYHDGEQVLRSNIVNHVIDYTKPGENPEDAIEEISAEKSGALYDLQGRRVLAPQKGLFIQSGKVIKK